MGITGRRILWAGADKLKLTGEMRIKVKAVLYPFYRLICKVAWKFGYLYLYHVEIPVTLKCSLKCKKCIFMIPYFKHPQDYKADDLIKYMDVLFSCVDRISRFRILGGEPFLYRDLDQIIEKALASDKVNAVDIVTNGTIMPDAHILNVMKNPKLSVKISDYGRYSKNKDRLKMVCNKEGIKCITRSSKVETWIDAGEIKTSRNRTKKQLKKQVRNCGNICRSFLNGRLYFCPRAAFGTKFGVPDVGGDFVDFTIEENKRDELRKQIYLLNQKKYLTACNYCDIGTTNCKSIPVAEQLEFKKGKRNVFS